MVGREVNFETEKEPAKPGKTILSIEKLNVYNKQDFQVVKDVSLEVHSGEIVAIAGVAGNGQVEIADAIAGLVPVRSGKILLNGRDITNLSIRERTTEGISYIPEDRQNYGLVMDFTLRRIWHFVIITKSRSVIREYWIRRFLKTTVKN